MPVAYMWDDHDYGINNAVMDSPSRPAALASYRACVPHPPFPGAQPAIYHAYTVGRVRFIALDMHSENVLGGQMIGDEQLNWLQGELRNAGNYALVVLLLGMPWIGDEKPMNNGWLGHTAARRVISNTISEVHANGKGGSTAGGYANIIGIAGDAHMAAFDDGTNSDYSDSGGAGFPLIHAAPLHNYGSDKGGPYSHGCFGYKLQNNFQYGSLEITDNGGTSPEDICLKLKLHRLGNNVLFEKEMCGPFLASGSGAKTECSIPLLPTVGLLLSIFLVVLFVAEIVIVVCLCGRSVTWQRYAGCSVLAATVLATIIPFGLLYYVKEKGNIPLNDITEIVTLLCCLVGLTLIILVAIMMIPTGSFLNAEECSQEQLTDEDSGLS